MNKHRDIQDEISILQFYRDGFHWFVDNLSNNIDAQKAFAGCASQEELNNWFPNDLADKLMNHKRGIPVKNTLQPSLSLRKAPETADSSGQRDKPLHEICFELIKSEECEFSKSALRELLFEFSRCMYNHIYSNLQDYYKKYGTNDIDDVVKKESIKYQRELKDVKKVSMYFNIRMTVYGDNFNSQIHESVERLGIDNKVRPLSFCIEDLKNPALIKKAFVGRTL